MLLGEEVHVYVFLSQTTILIYWNIKNHKINYLLKMLSIKFQVNVFLKNINQIVLIHRLSLDKYRLSKIKNKKYFLKKHAADIWSMLSQK